ncbi:hypothetical protein [uncultured Anaerofustis sp.]|uniref:hypothetical protein n=1 Tax=uncultured Anaerofustis sp. TaxID=904996 RepID=UPI0025DA3D3F|nr:hypothetical protein [uncultured Anaerofustis sp.]
MNKHKKRTENATTQKFSSINIYIRMLAFIGDFVNTHPTISALIFFGIVWGFGFITGYYRGLMNG